MFSREETKETNVCLVVCLLYFIVDKDKSLNDDKNISVKTGYSRLTNRSSKYKQQKQQSVKKRINEQTKTRNQSVERSKDCYLIPPEDLKRIDEEDHH